MSNKPITVLKDNDCINFINERQNDPSIMETLSEQVLRAAHEVSADLNQEITGVPVMVSGVFKDTQTGVLYTGWHLMINYCKKEDQRDTSGHRIRHWILEKIGERNIGTVHYLGKIAPRAEAQEATPA